jgi:ABC-type uncharacterized transport system involved in gliding motility auxiliary subunit
VTKAARRRAKQKARKTAVRRAASRVEPAKAAKKPRSSPSGPPAPLPRLAATAIALSELGRVLASPVAWLAGGVFVLVVSGLGFFATSVVGRQATMTGVFAVIANLLVLILAALLAAAFATRDSRRAWQVGLGRWLAGFALYVLLVATTLVYVVLLAVYAHGTAIDPGLVGALYIGLLVAGAAAIAVGALASVLARTPPAAFIVALGLLAVAWYTGYTLGFVTGPPLSSVLDYIGGYSRYQSFTLGLVSLRDVLFFLSLMAIALFIAVRLFRRRSRTMTATAAVAAVLIALNVVAAGGNQALDLTSSSLNTLAAPSVNAARLLNSDLNVIGLFRPGAGNGQVGAEALVSLYAAQSAHVKYVRASWDTDTRDVQRYRVKEPNTLVLIYAGKTATLSPRSQLEHDFTAALVELESAKVPVVCWATGVGSRDLKDTNQTSGYSGVADMLVTNDFITRDLAIGQVTSIPSDCDVVALAGATAALPAASVKALDAYLAGGGALLIASDPWQDSAITRSLSTVLEPFGRGFSGSLVVEPDPAHAFDLLTPAVLSYGASPITIDLAGVASFFPQSTAITVAPGPAVSSVAIGASSSGSYGIDRARADVKRQVGDAAGPFTIMSTLELPGNAKATRIVAVGTAAFAENLVLPPNSTDANLDLALATFDWLAGRDSLASIPAKPRRSPPLDLSRQDQTLLLIVTMVAMPGLMAGVAVLLAWRRRRAR